MCEQIPPSRVALRTASAPLPTRASLLDAVEREDTEGDGHSRLESGELKPARCLARDVVEVRRVAADDAAERDDAREAARLGKGRGGERELERPGHDHDRDRLLANAADDSSASAPSSSSLVTCPLKRDTTTPTARRPPSATPSSTAYPSGMWRSPAACSCESSTCIGVSSISRSPSSSSSAKAGSSDRRDLVVRLRFGRVSTATAVASSSGSAALAGRAPGGGIVLGGVVLGLGALHLELLLAVSLASCSASCSTSSSAQSWRTFSLVESMSRGCSFGSSGTSLS
jgi:hypothetical protein